MAKIHIDDFNAMWNLNPDGDKERALEVIEGVLDQTDLKTFDGNPISLQLLYDKYKKYLEWWDFTYGKREKKYIKTEDLKKQLDKWVITGQWKIDHTFDTNNKRDEYLFGTKYTIDELKVLVNNFKKDYGKTEDRS